MKNKILTNMVIRTIIDLMKETKKRILKMLKDIKIIYKIKNKIQKNTSEYFNIEYVYGKNKNRYIIRYKNLQWEYRLQKHKKDNTLMIYFPKKYPIYYKFLMFSVLREFFYWRIQHVESSHTSSIVDIYNILIKEHLSLNEIYLHASNFSIQYMIQLCICKFKFGHMTIQNFTPNTNDVLTAYYNLMVIGVIPPDFMSGKFCTISTEDKESLETLSKLYIYLLNQYENETMKRKLRLNYRQISKKRFAAQQITYTTDNVLFLDISPKQKSSLMFTIQNNQVTSVISPIPKDHNCLATFIYQKHQRQIEYIKRYTNEIQKLFI